MEYTVIFDVTESGYRNWWFPAFGLIFVIIGSLLRRFRDELPPSTPKFFPHFFFWFAVFWTTVAFIGTAGGHFGLAAALRNGRCEVVEGTVTQFHPQPPHGKGKESFTVGGKHFEYSDSFVSAGFNRSSPSGGPMREGLAVRIHYSGNKIARLEVAR